VGDALWRTDYQGIAPRAAVAYRIGGTNGREHVVRASAGVFYDIGWAGVATLTLGRGFPYSATRSSTNVTLPLPASSVPPLPTAGQAPGDSRVYALPEAPSLPRSRQWAIGYDDTVGASLSAGVTYIGARGDRLTRFERYDYSGRPDIPYPIIDAMATDGRSTYHAAEVRLRARAGRVLDGDLSYTLAESRDTVSSDVTVTPPSTQAAVDDEWGHRPMMRGTRSIGASA